MDLEKTVNEENVSKEYTDTVQAEYRLYLERFDVLAIKSLAELSGVKPELAEEEVQKAYAGYLSSGRYFTTAAVTIMQNLTGVKPEFPKDKLQEAYVAYAKDKNWYGLRELQKFTGVTPDLDVVRIYLTAKSE